jgi:hypothetical protein
MRYLLYPSCSGPSPWRRSKAYCSYGTTSDSRTSLHQLVNACSPWSKRYTWTRARTTSRSVPSPHSSPRHTQTRALPTPLGNPSTHSLLLTSPSSLSTSTPSRKHASSFYRPRTHFGCHPNDTPPQPPLHFPAPQPLPADSVTPTISPTTPSLPPFQSATTNPAPPPNWRHCNRGQASPPTWPR